MLTENPNTGIGRTGKLSRYILYAIGEIFLVVIGILIALWLNTLNQEKAQQNKIDSILVKIQNDIIQDIDNADWLIENYMRKDSIYTSMMSGDFSAEDLTGIPINGSYSLEFVTIWWMEYHIQANGYNLLKENVDIVPKKYDGLLKRLDEVYTFNQTTFETYNSNSGDIARQYKHYLSDNQPWMACEVMRKLNLFLTIQNSKIKCIKWLAQY
jgi:hypothetical protein